MANKIPVDTLYHASVVVRDARAAAHNYTEFYGIPRWKVVHHTEERLKNTTVHGRKRTAPPALELAGNNPIPGAYTFTTATGRNENGVEFELVQPTLGLSTFEEFLVTRGEGIHSVLVAVVEPGDFPALRTWLASEGVPVGQSFTVDDAADYYYFDTRKTLGGFYVQVVVPRVANWEAAIKADEEWDFSGEVERPAGVDAVQRVLGLTHFGVVVPDVVERVETFARLFDVPVWRGMHWHTEPGWLEDTTNNGQPVNHGYFTGRADVGTNRSGVHFGFEVIQPTYGPSHYKEDFLQVLGAGIHHVDLATAMEEWSEWDAVNRWLDAMGAPTCMSGWLRNHSALFHYQDTRRKLGYVTEIHPPREPGKGGRWAPDYWYDFSAKAAE
jgi:hypothetical protein